ncbi:MAG: hypothetical protein QNJ65_15575 [Xenococcaceae cyanobacterium MO_234.B1]|nr:hypothetical protein [Xenococcaceae cyanobacterium MO_234.B1]
MNNQDLINDRINDLEAQIIALTQTKKDRQAGNNSSIFKKTITIMTIPIIFSMLVLLGLNVNYKSGNKEISYDSNGLIEVTLLIVTSLSGSYAFQEIRNRNK